MSCAADRGAPPTASRVQLAVVHWPVRVVCPRLDQRRYVFAVGFVCGFCHPSRPFLAVPSRSSPAALPVDAVCVRCSGPVLPVASPDAPAMEVDDSVVVVSPPVLPFKGLIPHMPCDASLGPAETMPEMPGEPARFRRFDKAFGWYTYHAGTGDAYEFILFHPLPHFPFTADMLRQAAQLFPDQATPELAAMSAYLTFAKGRFCSN